MTPEDKKPLVMIDAGHGGQDPGAIGLHETHEKDITLAFARALREALLRTGRYRVALTREDDRFIMLTDRVAMARKIGAGHVHLLPCRFQSQTRSARAFHLFPLRNRFGR